MENFQDSFTDLLSFDRKPLRRERKKVFDGKCVYCQKPSDSLTLDHFIPKSKQGRNDIENLVPCCLSCNGDKGCELPNDWYFRQSFFMIKQWLFILSLVGKEELDRLGRSEYFEKLEAFRKAS